MSETEKQSFEAPFPKKHLKEIIDGLDNTALHSEWDSAFDKKDDLLKTTYNSLPIFKRLKIDNAFAIVSSMHPIEERMIFICYQWIAGEETFTPVQYEMTDLDKLRVLVDENEISEFDVSIKSLNLSESNINGSEQSETEVQSTS